MDVQTLFGDVGTIAGAIGAVVSLMLIFRRLGSAQRTAQDAADKAGNAADKAGNAARASAQTQSAAKNTSADVIQLAEELAERDVKLAKMQEAMTRMADHNDDLWAAFLQDRAELRQQRIPERLQRVEGWAQIVSRGNQMPGPRDEPLPARVEAGDDDGDAFVTTGRHRFPTRAVPTIKTE